MCRSRRELSRFSFSIFFHVPFSQSSFQIYPNSNEYLIVKFGFDTAENVPALIFNFLYLCTPSHYCYSKRRGASIRGMQISPASVSEMRHAAGSGIRRLYSRGGPPWNCGPIYPSYREKYVATGTFLRSRHVFKSKIRLHRLTKCEEEYS